MKKKKIIVLVLIVIIFIVVRIIIKDHQEHPEYKYYRNKSEVEAAVQTILETGETDGIQIPGISEIRYRYKENHPVIAFQTFEFGLAPSSKEFGFYYSVDSVPVGYKGNTNPLIKYGDYWRWIGSGQGETKHIEGKWYTYKYRN